MKKIFSLILVVLALISLSSTALAVNNTSRYTYSGTSADAMWSLQNKDGSYTDVWVSVNQIDKQTTEVYVNKFSYALNGRKFRELGNYFNVFTIPAGDFSISKDLSTATLNTVTGDGSINLAWNMTEFGSSKSTYSYQTGDVKVTSKNSGNYANGTVSGSIFGQDYGLGNGSIYQSRSMDIVKGTLPW